MAHQEGWVEAYKLLENGQDIPADLLSTIKNNKNGLDESFLHWYALEGEFKIVEKIMHLGLNVNTQNKFGNTPLMECALIDRWDIVELLLKNGADPEVKNQGGENAVAYLRDNFSKAKALKLSQLIDLVK
jgi:ankyrin repeat protein